MMRLRSSSKCWSRLIEPNWRPSSFSGSTSRLGIVVLGDILDTIGQATERAGHGIRIPYGGDDFTCVGGDILDGVDRVLQFEIANFLVNLVLELITGTLEFRHKAAHLAGNLGKLARPKKHQGQHREENHFCAEIHSFVLDNDTAGHGKKGGSSDLLTKDLS